MDEYISREATLNLIEHNDKVCHYADERYENVVYATTQTICKVVAEMSTADVQPVVHAYWIELPKALNPNENPCKCSNCGHVLSFMNYYPKSKYCDDCGARMDLKDGGAE